MDHLRTKEFHSRKDRARTTDEDQGSRVRLGKATLATMETETLLPASLWVAEALQTNLAEADPKGHGSFDRQRARQTCSPMATCAVLLDTCSLAFYLQSLIGRNSVAVSPFDFPHPQDGSDLYLMLNGNFVFTARPWDGFPQGHISLSDPQRTWASVSLMDTVNAHMYSPFSDGGRNYLGSADLEVGFAGKKNTEAPYDQDELASHFVRV